MGHRIIISGLCPQFVDGLSVDPRVMFEKVDHLTITVTRQNTFQEGKEWIVFSGVDLGNVQKFLSTQT